MPKPLAAEHLDKPIHEQVQFLLREAYANGMKAVGVTFSVHGYRVAQHQNVPGMQAFTGDREASRYLSLPFTVDCKATKPVSLVLVLVSKAAQVQA